MYLQENKRTNLRIAISHLNNILIHPGETFSIWKNVGRPVKRKGYLEGLVLKQGTISKDIGGGLCQLGNLLFWIFAHSPLTITERYRHGFDVFPDINRNVPFGAGATLSYNHIDLQVKNNTNSTFQIKLWLDETHLNGELLSSSENKSTYQVEERNHIIKQQIWGGYSRHNQIIQMEFYEDSLIEEKIIVENHAIMMYNPFLEQKTKS
jgi:vancomycin resistance protein VanW